MSNPSRRDALSWLGTAAVAVMLAGIPLRSVRAYGTISPVYPKGTRFGVGLYSLDSGWAEAAGASFTMGHTYSTDFTPGSFFANEEASGLLTLGSLPADESGGQFVGRSETAIAGDINAGEAEGTVAFWYLPEEMRYWVPSELAIVQNYSAWTRAYDADRLPNSMYIPGNYTTATVQAYVPYLDILFASCYAGQQGAPKVYNLWSVDRTRKAIANAGHSEGKAYLNGQKTVFAALELFNDSQTPAGIKHDFWATICHGARGLMAFSHAYIGNSQNLADCWNALKTQTTHLKTVSPAILTGTAVPSIAVSITSGPAKCAAWTSHDGNSIVYPSVSFLAKQKGTVRYIIAVNSNTSAVTARFAGLPNNKPITVMWENRTIAVSSNRFSDSFAALGTHVYRQAI